MAFLRSFLDRLQFKVFSSGSQGYFRQAKFKNSQGQSFQVQATAVLIGSKDKPSIEIRASAQEVAYAFVPILQGLAAKKFRTGRHGYFAQGKVKVAGERYQLAVQAVEIRKGS